MTDTIPDLGQIDDLGQARRRLGELINLDGPASAAITRRAMADERFAFYLLFTKDSPELQRQLLEDPRNRDFDGASGDGASGDAPDAPSAQATVRGADQGSLALAGKAAKALYNWGKAGFAAADEETIERRWAACRACAFMTDPPETMMYQGVKLLSGRGTKICGSCGCLINKKVATPTERCPEQDPDDPTRSRWGDAWAAAGGDNGIARVPADR